MATTESCRYNTMMPRVNKVVAVNKRNRPRQYKAKPGTPGTKGTGAPSAYTEELGRTICDRLSRGEQLTAICKSEGIPDIRTVWDWMSKYPLFDQAYCRARLIQGTLFGEKVTSLSERCERGELQPNAARVAMEGYKWAAGKMDPRTWGDRTQIEHGGMVTVKAYAGFDPARLVADDPEALDAEPVKVLPDATEAHSTPEA